jgi:hypothetical protein
MTAIKHFPVELACWTSALAVLAFSNPTASHFSLCPLANLGIKWCPGCGLGHSIAAFLHGDVRLSLHYHWFGIPATAILIHRTVPLTRTFLQSSNLIKLKP